MNRRDVEYWRRQLEYDAGGEIVVEEDGPHLLVPEMGPGKDASGAAASHQEVTRTHRLRTAGEASSFYQKRRAAQRQVENEAAADYWRSLGGQE